MKEDKSFYPINIRFLCSQAIMLNSDNLSYLV